MAAVQPTAPKSFSKVDPYKQYENAYAAQQNAVNAANDAQVLERQNRERLAQQNLEAGNRMVNTSFVRQNSPQSKFQQQNNFSSGVSDYLNGANYSSFLKGIGQNQQNYTEAMNNSNTLWQNWLAQKAGQEAQNAGDYADKMAAQGNKDRDFNYNQYRDQMADYQWQTNFDWNKARDDRDYKRNVFESDRSYNYQVGRDKVADTQWQTQFDYNKSRDAVGDQQWQKQFDEGVRQFNLNYDLSKGSSGGSGSGGGGGRSYGGGSGSDGYDFASQYTTPSGDYSKYDNYTTLGAQDQSHSQNSGKVSKTVVKTTYEPSTVSGKQYKVETYSDGRTKKTLVGTGTKKTQTTSKGKKYSTNVKGH